MEKAKIGPVLRSDSPPLTNVEKESYRDLATRLSSPALIAKLFDKDLLILPGKKGGWVEAGKGDEEIVSAMVFLYERMKLVTEPSGAVGVAALLSGKLDARDRTVGVIVSGGNVGAARFAELVRK